MVRLAFITDQHISLDVENALGIDTKARFLDVLDIIRKRQYDGIILGGDMCYTDGELSVYQWFYQMLQPLQTPVFVIPGNHDDPAMMASAFPGLSLNEEKELFYQTSWGDIRMLFLDTTKGFMLEKQYKWLAEQVATSKCSDIWISMHHPPVLTGSKHMDGKYAFQQIEKFSQFCSMHPSKSFHIFSGHCHLERTIVTSNMHVYITPSTYVNIDPEFDEFTPLRWQKNGFRELIWPNPGTFLTNVLYVD